MPSKFRSVSPIAQFSLKTNTRVKGFVERQSIGENVSNIAKMTDTATESTKKRLGVPYKMYVSRALSAWGDRMWEFGGGLFLMALVRLKDINLRKVLNIL